MSASARLEGRAARRWLAAALFCLVFGLVYAQFSHGVSSPFMRWLWLWPLAGGAVPAAILAVLHKAPGAAARGLYRAALATLTVGSLMTGVFEIYGSSPALLAVYWVVGGLLAGGAAVAGAAEMAGARRNRRAGPSGREAGRG